MLKRKRTTWKPGTPISQGKEPRRVTSIKGLPGAKKEIVVLLSVEPLSSPFFLTSGILRRTTRKASVQSWEDFFKELRRAFTQGSGETIEKYQHELLASMLDWLRWLVCTEPFTRGKARAIEEVMTDFCAYVVAEAEKFRDRYRFWLGRERFTTDWRWRVTEHLRGKFYRQRINPMKLHELPEKLKKAGRDFTRKHYRNPQKVDTLIKEIFSRKPSITQGRVEPTYRPISKHTPFSP